VKPLHEERLRLEQPSVASRGIRIGRLVPVSLRGGYPLEWRWGTRTSHRTRDDRASRLEEGGGTPASHRWSRGEASSSLATDWAARRGQGRARVWRGHARERWGGRKLAAPASGCSLVRTVRGVRTNLHSVIRSCAPIYLLSILFVSEKSCPSLARITTKTLKSRARNPRTDPRQRQPVLAVSLPLPWLP